MAPTTARFVIVCVLLSLCCRCAIAPSSSSRAQDGAAPLHVVLPATQPNPIADPASDKQFCIGEILAGNAAQRAVCVQRITNRLDQPITIQQTASLAKALAEMRKAGLLDDIVPLAAKGVVASAQWPDATRDLMMLRASALNAQGKTDEALRSAKGAFAVATMKGTAETLHFVEQFLKTSKRYGRGDSELFILEQVAGAADAPASTGEKTGSVFFQRIAAEDCFHETIQHIDASSPESLLSLTNLLLISGRPAEARATIQRIQTTDPAFHSLLVEAYARTLKAEDGVMGRANHYLFAHLGNAILTPGASISQATLPFDDDWTNQNNSIALPRVANIKIDGDDSDWASSGLKLNLLASEAGGMRSPTQFDPRVRLGWDDRGLLIAARVVDRTPYEHDYQRHLFKADSIELFVGKTVGSAERFMLVVSPGVAPPYREPRFCFFNDPSKRTDAVNYDVQIKRKRISGGYLLELLLPWSNLHFKPAVGQEVALQIYAIDAVPGDSAPPFVASWHPRADTHLHSSSAWRAVLTDGKPSTTDIAVRCVADPHSADVDVSVLARQDLVGRPAQLFIDGKLVQASRLTLEADHAAAHFRLARNIATAPLCQVSVEGLSPVLCTLPQASKLADAKRLATGITVKFRQYAFSGDTFPPFALEGEDAQLFKTTPTFYDEHYKVVDHPAAPGRYGAAVKLSGPEIQGTLRFVTLYRLPDDAASADFADPNLPSLLSAAARPPTTDPALDAISQNRQWWVGLKRKIYDLKPAPAIQAPLNVSNQLAPVLREGSPTSAGVDPRALEAIDTILKQTAVEFPTEPLAVCFARHGVVFFHHAYGICDGAPMTVNTICDMQSGTKAVSGTLMLMLADAGLVDLDAGPDKYLPPLRGHVPREPLTIRHLYTHTSGLAGTSDDTSNDLEEIIACYSSYIQVGTYLYGGTGHALGAKIIEAISGEALPYFCHRHLLQPLGMSKTTVLNSHYETKSVSLDMAKFAQLWLNQGTYGNMRFFSQKSYFAALPPPRVDSARAMELRGIGFYRYAGGELGDSAFFADSANAGMVIIVPDHDMVLVFTSRGERKQMRRCYPKIFTLLRQALRNP
jgi:CubicO group peptidase (beta-lactamase class C family)